MMPEDKPPGIVARTLCLLIRAYQLVLKPVMPKVCRFTPSCSAYMIEALTVHGALKGTWLGLCRISRCHPWHPGGYDPVPPRDAPRQCREKNELLTKGSEHIV